MKDIVVHQRGLDPCFGSFIKKHREACGLSQRQLAGHIGMSQPWVCKLEGGSVEAMPALTTLFRLEEALGIPRADLLDAAGWDFTESGDVVWLVSLLYAECHAASPPRAFDLPEIPHLNAVLSLPEEERHLPRCRAMRERHKAWLRSIKTSRDTAAGPSVGRGA